VYSVHPEAKEKWRGDSDEGVELELAVFVLDHSWGSRMGSEKEPANNSLEGQVKLPWNGNVKAPAKQL
jgi:hypothetical protein